MDATTVEKLTQDYSQKVRKEWGNFKFLDGKGAEAFTLLQAREESKQEDKKAEKSIVELSRIVNQANHIVLLGEPGSGKSTILKFLCLYFAGEEWTRGHITLKDKQKYIPVFISLQENAPDSYEKLRTLAVTTVSSFLGEKEAVISDLYDEWERENKSYQFVFLFDGLDEIEDKPKVQSFLRIFSNSNIGKRSRIFISSRITGFSKFLENFKEITLEPLRNNKERNDFLAKWLTALGNKQPEQEAEKLIEKLRLQSALNSILDNPLSLQMIAETYHYNKTIPSNRADIYKEYFYRIAEQRNLDFEADSTQRQNAKTALMAIAWHIHMIGERKKESLVNAVMGDAKKDDDAKSLFALVYEKLNIISEQNNEFKFHHQTIQDYFVAERLKESWIKDSKATWKFIRPRLHLPKWKEPLSLLVTGLDEKNKVNFIAKVKTARSRYENKLHRDYFLAAKYIGENGLDKAVLADSYLKKARSRLSSKQRLAIEALGYIGGRLAVSLIYMAYRNKNLWEVASEAVVRLDEKSLLIFLTTLKQDGLLHSLTWNIIFRLGEIGSTEAIEALTQVIERRRDTASMTRWQAVRALGQIHDAKTLPLIVQALNKLIDDRIGDVNDVLAPETFAKFDDEQSVGMFCMLIKDESENKPYPSIRQLIVKRLGEIGNTQAANDLLDVVKNEDDEFTCREAVQALGKIGSSSITEDLNLLSEKIGTSEAVLEIYCRQDVSFLLQLLAKYVRDDNYLRYTVIEALGIIGNPTAIPDLVAIAEKECDSPFIGRVRDEIILAFARLRDPRAIPILLKVLENNRLRYKRYEANVINALGKIGDVKAVQPLIEIVSNKSIYEYTRYDAITALGKIGGPEATNALVQILHNTDEDNRRFVNSAIEALGEIADHETIDVIISMLEYQDQTYYSNYQMHAAVALGKIGNPKAIPALIKALAYFPKEASWKSAIALGEIFNKQPDPEKVKAEALPALLGVIEKADDDFNWGALQFLGSIGNGSERAVTVLHKLIGKKYWQGWWAENILTEIGGLESVSTLMRANKQEAVISILQRWHSKSNKADETERQKKLKNIRSLALKIKRRLVVNKFESLLAKIVLKRKKNPSWHYERWHYMSTDDTKLVTTLAEIIDDISAPRFDPLRAPSRPLWHWVVLAGMVFALLGILSRIFGNSQSLLFAALISILAGFGGWILDALRERIKSNTS